MRIVRDRISTLAMVAIISSVMTGSAFAIPDSQDQATESAIESLDDVRVRSIDAYTVRRGLKARTEAAQIARRRAESLPPGILAVSPIVGDAVAGKVEVPVFMVQFADTATPPYPVADLQQQLFDGPWPTGTVTEHYDEMSDGRLEVTGEVFDWTSLPEDGDFYVGPPGCNAICEHSKLGDMLTTALDKIDAEVDFTQFDNDGPDNVPNSGDDDGFADFVAFVHPKSGGECTGNDRHPHSHRFSIEAWTGESFETNDVGHEGFSILIDDYVIMPALACDNQTMIQIGVNSHEIAHAFGLPDLYDSRKPSDSSGIGGWGLMASGSWGGDGNSSPETPTHMTAWSKEFLGWVTPRVIEDDQTEVRIEPFSTTGDVVRVDYSDAADPEDIKYLLLEFRTTDGFDASLVSSGLLVTEINNSRVQGGLQNNSVNGEPFDMGVNVIEADGERDLDNKSNRGDGGDVFPGSMQVTSLDSTHAEGIGAALCNIVRADDHITLDIFTSRTTCPDALLAAAVTPAQALDDDVLRGTEVVVEGRLINEGTNYFTDRQLVVKGLGPTDGTIMVTAPAPLEMAPDPDGSRSPSEHQELSDILDKKVVVRGMVQKSRQKGIGLTDVLVIKEIEVLD